MKQRPNIHLELRASVGLTSEDTTAINLYRDAEEVRTGIRPSIARAVRGLARQRLRELGYMSTTEEDTDE